MKKINKLSGFIALAAMIGSTCMPLASCVQPVNAPVNKPVNSAKGIVQVVAMNISEASGGEWDWIAAVDNESKSTMLFNVDEETGKIPTRLYYKPDKDLDASMNFICRENGLPEMMEFNGYILYFDNFSGYTFDLAVVAPDETVEYHFGIEYDIDFDSWGARFMADGAARSVYGGGRSMLDAFTGGFSDDPVGTAIDVIGYLVDLGTCVASIFLPPLLVGCIVGAISQVVDIGLSVLNYFVNDTDFIGEMGEWTINGVNLMIDALGCMTMIIGKKWTDYKAWLDCGAAFLTLADVIWGTVQNLFEYFSSSGTKDKVKEEMKPVIGQAKVNFYLNGGSGAVPAARTVETANGYGAVTLPGVAGFSRTGYSTLGWYTSPKGNNYYAPGAERMVSGNTSFYVNWIQDTPNAPAGVTAVAVSSSSIKVSWAAFPGAGYYNVYRSTSASGTYERVGGNVSGTSYTDKGLSLNTTYYYKVSAWSPGAKGESDKSAYASAKILPDVPIGVTATTISSSSIRVNWDAFDGATLYYVYRSTSASGVYEKIPGNVSAPLTAFIDTGLSANTMYYYKVSAWRPGANGQTGQSAAASARTQAGSSGGGTAPAISTAASLPNGTVGTPYSHTLTASGDTPITWSIESGALPAGLTISTAGVIAGNPTTAGAFNFTVKATNAAGSVTKQLSITTTSITNPPPGGTSMDDAIPLSENIWTNGNLPQSSEQWFVFTATASEQYIHFERGTLPSSALVYVQVYDSSEAMVGYRTVLADTTTNASRSLTPGQTYYIMVSSFDSYSGDYRIGFNTSFFAPGPFNGASRDEAVPLTENQWWAGYLPSGVQWWFTFTAAASTQYIHIEPALSANLYMQVYDSSGAAVGSEESRESGSSSTSISRSLTPGQTYYIRVRPYNSVSYGSYRIAFSAIIAPPSAIPLTDNQWVGDKAELEVGKIQQWFAFTATASTYQYIHIKYARLERMYVSVYDSSNALVISESDIWGTNGDIYSFGKQLTAGQAYYIRVRQYWTDSTGLGSYDIAFSATAYSPGTTLIPLTDNQWADGAIPPDINKSRKEQWFTFTATASTQWIYADLDLLNNKRLSVSVYDSSSIYVGGVTLSSSAPSGSQSLTPGQTYYIRTRPAYANTYGGYRIAFNAITTAPTS